MSDSPGTSNPRALDLLLAGAAHDLNNIFSQVLMLIELLPAADVDEDMDEMLTGLKSSIQRGIGIAGQLFDQSSIGDGVLLNVSLKQLASAVQKRSHELVPNASVASRYPDAVSLSRLDPQVVLDTLLFIARARAEEEPGCSIEIIVVQHPGEEDTSYVSIASTAPASLARAGLPLADGDPEPDHPVWVRAREGVVPLGGWLEGGQGSQGPLLRLCFPTVG